MLNKSDKNQGSAGIRLAQELMVDIMGALIPGVLFLFSIVVSGVFPILTFYGLPFNLNQTSTKTTGLEFMQGWFWLVIFLTFLILAYTIGHIFYRSDIKIPDKKGLLKQRKEFINNFCKELKNENFENSNKKLFKYVLNKLIQEIKYLSEFPEDLCENKSKTLERFFGMNTKDFENLIEELKAISDSSSPFLSSELKWKNKILKILFPHSEQDIECSENTIIKEYTTIIEKKLKNFIKKNEKLTKNEKQELTKNEEQKLIKDKEQKLIKDVIILYCILDMQCECACATANRCNFPYINYYKYLLKRNEIDLLSEVSWYLPNARSKNKINRYKIFIQTHQPKTYFIITKNESHIRMAASSWYVANTLLPYTIILTILFLTPLIVNLIFNKYNLSIFSEYSIYNSENASSLIAFLFPLFIFFLLIIMKKKIVTFIHYQRLREIYHTLIIYKECPKNNNK